LDKGTPRSGKIGSVYIKEKAFESFKENPKSLSLYFDVSKSSIKTYISAYKSWLRISKMSDNPKDLLKVKAKMVTLWREGRPITKKNLKENLDISSTRIGEVLSTLIKNREAKYDNQKDEYEVVWTQ